jgi:hypothetical protein
MCAFDSRLRGEVGIRVRGTRRESRSWKEPLSPTLPHKGGGSRPRARRASPQRNGQRCRRIKTGVVLANASTHNLRRLGLIALQRQLWQDNKGLGLWAPPCAGATREGLTFQTAAASRKTRLRDLAARFARGLPQLSPSENQRAQGRPGARCTRGLACNFTWKKRTRAYRFSGNTPAFPAQWF